MSEPDQTNALGHRSSTTTSKFRVSVMAVLSEFVTVYAKVYVPG